MAHSDQITLQAISNLYDVRFSLVFIYLFLFIYLFIYLFILFAFFLICFELSNLYKNFITFLEVLLA